MPTPSAAMPDKQHTDVRRRARGCVLGVEDGAGRRSKQSRRKLIRAAGAFLAVAAAEGLLVSGLDLTGTPVRAPRTAADDWAPYDLTTESALRSAPKAHTAERRPPKRRKPDTAAGAPPSPPAAPSLSPPVTAAPPAASAGPLAPDYGRWTVAPGAWPETGRGRVVTSVCDPANLANLPADARTACVERLETAAAGAPGRGAALERTQSVLLRSEERAGAQAAPGPLPGTRAGAEVPLLRRSAASLTGRTGRRPAP